MAAMRGVFTVVGTVGVSLVALGAAFGVAWRVFTIIGGI